MTELSIKLKIANREYPMKVKAEDEEGIRKAGKLVNEKIKAYRDQFGIDDNQDLLAMVAFDCLVDKMKKEETIESSDEIALDQIRNISQLITNAI
ncbi:cell division protein ZapA [Marinoscillum sp.]|uniref:cell division protein ZapA n=1 Tax=Marinoscillum sp. TaxID=2024838 RepID=UPI003BA90F5D